MSLRQIVAQEEYVDCGARHDENNSPFFGDSAKLGVGEFVKLPR